MTKIIALSDMHLGIRPYGLQEREEDIYNAFFKNIKEIKKEKPDAVILCGDSFDKPKPSPYCLDKFRQGLDELDKENIPVYFIIGNHTKLITVSHLEPELIFQNPNYHLLTEDEVVINDTAIFGLSYHYVNDIPDLLKKLKKMSKNAKKYKTSILVLHQAISPFCGAFGADFDISDIPKEFDIVLNGHIHNRELYKENIIFCQPGSTERISVSEHINHIQQGKGYTVIEDGDIYFRDIELERPMIPFEADLEKLSLEEIYKDIIESINNNKFFGSKSPLLYITLNGEVPNSDIQDFIKKINSCSLYCKVTVNKPEDKYIAKFDEEFKKNFTVENFIKKRLNEENFSEEHQNLALEIFKSSMNKKDDIEDIINKGFEEFCKQKKKDEITKDNFYQETKEYEEFFDNLGAGLL